MKRLRKNFFKSSKFCTVCFCDYCHMQKTEINNNDYYYKKINPCKSDFVKK